MTEHEPTIVLQPPNRHDTIPGVIKVAPDGFISFKGAFASWTVYVPAYARGPEDVLAELAEDMGD